MHYLSRSHTGTPCLGPFFCEYLILSSASFPTLQFRNRGFEDSPSLLISTLDLVPSNYWGLNIFSPFPPDRKDGTL